jgi:hypothetical protein
MEDNYQYKTMLFNTYSVEKDIKLHYVLRIVPNQNCLKTRFDMPYKYVNTTTFNLQVVPCFVLIRKSIAKLNS